MQSRVAADSLTTGLALSCRAGAFALSIPGAGQLIAEIHSHQRKARQ